MKLTYLNEKNELITQTGSITAGQDYGFKVPFSISYDGDVGCVLEINAIGGIQVARVRIHQNPECFHVW